MLAPPLLLLRLIVRPSLCCLLRNIHLGNGREAGVTVFSPALEPLLGIWPSGLEGRAWGLNGRFLGELRTDPGHSRPACSTMLLVPFCCFAWTRGLEALGFFQKP